MYQCFYRDLTCRSASYWRPSRLGKKDLGTTIDDAVWREVWLQAMTISVCDRIKVQNYPSRTSNTCYTKEAKWMKLFWAIAIYISQCFFCLMFIFYSLHSHVYIVLFPIFAPFLVVSEQSCVSGFGKTIKMPFNRLQIYPTENEINHLYSAAGE